MNRILIIEDDPDIALSLKYSLERDGGFQARVAPDGETGVQETRRTRPDLVVLDLNLPGMDGMETCRQLRRCDGCETLPIIMLTARVEEPDRIAGLDEGADDYITKPFSLREVQARIRAVLRRSRTPREEPDAFILGPLQLDHGRRRVTVDGVETRLTRKEFDLLAELMRRPGQVFTRQQLLENVWGYDDPGATRTVDVHVRQLRKKLGLPIADAIETVVGVGYRMGDPD